MNYLIFYLIVINFIGFLSMLLDKRRARKNLWRIPEKTLFLVALLGGSTGSILGMHLFHHKTKHWYFLWGMPVLLICQLAAAYFIFSAS